MGDLREICSAIKENSEAKKYRLGNATIEVTEPWFGNEKEVKIYPRDCALPSGTIRISELDNVLEL